MREEETDRIAQGRGPIRWTGSGEREDFAVQWAGKGHRYLDLCSIGLLIQQCLLRRRTTRAARLEGENMQSSRFERVLDQRHLKFFLPGPFLDLLNLV